MAKQVTCQQFTDFLIRRTPHYDLDILKDVTPSMGWIGQVPTGTWGAFEGTTKIGHRIRRMFPNMASCWSTVIETGCIGTPCDPDRLKVGFGFDQFQYGLEEIYYETDIFCFPLIMSADAAKEQFAALIQGLREATVHIWNHRYRTDAVRLAKTQVLAGSTFAAATPSWNSDCTRMTVSAEPASKLTIQFLQRYVDILSLNGYFGTNPLGIQAQMMVELITDAQSSNDLRELNPALKDFLRLVSVEEFGRLYKYGITGSIGNFMIHLDPTPLRYEKVTATTYDLLMPYVNNPATEGIGADENLAYINGAYQWSLLWHRGVMKSMVRRSEAINSQMPFPARDFGGRWKFVMDNMTCRDANGNIVPVDNIERTKGKFIANFSAATKPEHTEWAVAIFHQRALSCVTNVTTCVTVPAYAAQNYSSANAPCPSSPIYVDLPAAGPFVIVSANCNGVDLGGLPSASQATTALLVTYLNANLAAYGTWALDSVNNRLVLTGSTCATFNIVITGSV